MTQLSFKGSGTTDIENQVGIGQGLQVGITKIDFGVGKIQLSNSSSQNKTVGKIKNFKALGAPDNTVRSFIFKAATKCTIQYQNTFIEYNLLNEWFTLNGIETELIEIVRSASGITPDIFDYTFLASDKPNFSISVEKGTRDSDSEILFESLSRAANTYTKVFNTQNAPKITLVGKATSGTGTASVTLEEFDAASGDWVELASVEDIFTLQNGQTKTAHIGEGVDRVIKSGQGHGMVMVTGGAPNATVGVFPEGYVIGTLSGGEISGGLTRNLQYPLPAGDNILRVKVVIASTPLTFSLGVIKVFN